MRRGFSCKAIMGINLLVILGACSKPVPARSEFVMGTFCRVDLFEDGSAALYDRLFVRLAELETILSANKDDSELARVNQSAGLAPVEVSDELFTVLERALYFAKASDGAFDPTIGPLVKLWGIGTETPRVPSGEEIAAALDLVNWRGLELGTAPPPAAVVRETDNSTDDTASGAAPAAGKTAFLARRGMALDLGAIAKGFAADELARIIREAGVKRALLDLGGNIYVVGKKALGERWLIGVQDPRGVRGEYAGALSVEGDCSVVSSGTYERVFTGADGKRYHHILELSADRPEKRGYPVENGALSVTIIAPSSMDADALSTSCFALGFTKGRELALANGAELLHIDENKNMIRATPGALAMFNRGN